MVVAVLFLLRLAPWMMSDLWFDEVLTFDDYALQQNWLDVVSRYGAANNHVLFSIILWGWVQIIDPLLFEWLMRLPSALFSTAMIVLAIVHWRKWLGDRPAVACGVTVAASLVVGSFAWQLRGYSLSMLLGALAVSGLMELVNGSRRRGLIFYLPAALLLPVTLPTNVSLVAAHVMFLLTARPKAVKWIKWLLQVVVPIALATSLGCSFYLGVLEQLRAVLKHAEGWPSAWAVARIWGLGLLAHLGLVLPLFFWQHRALVGRSPSSPAASPRDDLGACWKLLAPIIALVAVFLVIQHPSPFPRTFLVFLPTVTFAVFFACRSSPLWARVQPAAIAVLIALHGLSWQRVTDRLTGAALDRGEHPQHLLMQYYRGRSDASRLSAEIKRSGEGEGVAVLVDFHDFSTTRYYWRVQRLPADRVMTAAWRNKAQGWQARFGSDVTLLVQAANEDAARKLLERANQSLSLRGPLFEANHLAIWSTETDAAPAATAPAP